MSKVLGARGKYRRRYEESIINNWKISNKSIILLIVKGGLLMAESTKQARPLLSVIQLKGEFNLENRKLVEIDWSERLAKNPVVIAFDCKELRHIDSSAIGTLVQFLQTAMNRDVKMVLCDLNESIYELFKLACLNKFFTITTMETVTQECGAKV